MKSEEIRIELVLFRVWWSLIDIDLLCVCSQFLLDTVFLDCRLLLSKVVCYEGSELWMVDLEVCGMAVSMPTSSFISSRLLATWASSGGFCMLLAPYISTGLK